MFVNFLPPVLVREFFPSNCARKSRRFESFLCLRSGSCRHRFSGLWFSCSSHQTSCKDSLVVPWRCTSTHPVFGTRTVFFAPVLTALALRAFFHGLALAHLREFASHARPANWLTVNTLRRHADVLSLKKANPESVHKKSKAKSARSTHETSQILTMLQTTSSFSNQNYGMSNSKHSSGGCHPPEYFEFEIRAHGMFMRMMMQARSQFQVSLLLELRAAPKH